LLLVDLSHSVVLALNGDWDLNDILNDLLDDLLDWVGNLNSSDLLDGNPDDLNLGNRNVIGHLHPPFNDAWHLHGNRPLDDPLHGIRDLYLNRHRDRDWGGDRNIALNNLLHNLLDGVWDRPLYDPFHWNRDGDGDTDVNRPWDLNHLFDQLLDRVGDLSMGDVLHWIRNGLLNDLLHRHRDVNGDGHWDGPGHLDDVLHHLLHWVWNWSVDGHFNRHWDLDFADLLDGVGDRSLDDLFDWEGNLNALWDEDFIGLREGSVDEFLDWIRDLVLDDLLNRNGPRDLDDGLDGVGDTDFLWNRHWDGDIDSLLNESVNGHWERDIDRALDGNCLRGLYNPGHGVRDEFLLGKDGLLLCNGNLLHYRLRGDNGLGNNDSLETNNLLHSNEMLCSNRSGDTCSDGSVSGRCSCNGPAEISAIHHSVSSVQSCS
jgi:hypothetical protein